MNYIETIIVSCIAALAVAATIAAGNDIRHSLDKQVNQQIEIIEDLPEILDQSRHPLNVSDMYEQFFAAN